MLTEITRQEPGDAFFSRRLNSIPSIFFLPGGKLWAGLGVPDRRGTWGTFFYFGSDLTEWDVGDTEFGGKLVQLKLDGNHAASTIEFLFEAARPFHAES